MKFIGAAIVSDRVTLRGSVYRQRLAACQTALAGYRRAWDL